MTLREDHMTVNGNPGRPDGIRGAEWLWLIAALAVMLLFAIDGRAASPAQKTFATPEDAVSALVAAVKAHDRPATLDVLGNAGEWIGSGDATADRATAERFVASYDAKHAIAVDGDKATLSIGPDDYPFAFPLVRTGERWRFDTAAGKDEMLARRIGANELDAIKTLQAIVDAQYEYVAEDRDGNGAREYAGRIVSRKGRHDGLYWPTADGEPQSPLGPLIARATAEGYARKGTAPTPFHGYYFKMLNGQGRNAPGGAVDYVVRGRQIGGFAVVAYPARYANSGIMTFIVNQDGKIFEADLGPQTAARVAAMRRYDPGKGWTPVAPR